MNNPKENANRLFDHLYNNIFTNTEKNIKNEQNNVKNKGNLTKEKKE